MSAKKHSEKRAALKIKLEARGAHLTRQRAAVHDYLSEVEHHPTAEEVYLAVKQRLPKISLATVYKNLEALVNALLCRNWRTRMQPPATIYAQLITITRVVLVAGKYGTWTPKQAQTG